LGLDSARDTDAPQVLSDALITVRRHEREAEEAPPSKATSSSRRAEAALGAAGRPAGGRRAKLARLQPPTSRRGPPRQHLDNRPTARPGAEHRQDAVGSAADPRRRARALPRRAPRAAA